MAKTANLEKSKKDRISVLSAVSMAFIEHSGFIKIFLRRYISNCQV